MNKSITFLLTLIYHGINFAQKTYLHCGKLIDMHVHIKMQISPANYIEAYTLNEADIAFNSVKYAQVTLLAGLVFKNYMLICSNIRG